MSPKERLWLSSPEGNSKWGKGHINRVPGCEGGEEVVKRSRRSKLRMNVNINVRVRSSGLQLGDPKGNLKVGREIVFPVIPVKAG